MEKLFLTEAEVSAIFGIGRRHLQQMRARNSGPRFRKISGRIGSRGGEIRYAKADVQAWLDSVVPSGGAPAEVNR